MASGDIVLEAPSLTVHMSLAGSKPFFSTIFRGAASGDGWRVALGGAISGGEVQIADILFQASSGSLSSPFDPTKTYDVIIKEH